MRKDRASRCLEFADSEQACRPAVERSASPLRRLAALGGARRAAHRTVSRYPCPLARDRARAHGGARANLSASLASPEPGGPRRDRPCGRPARARAVADACACGLAVCRELVSDRPRRRRVSLDALTHPKAFEAAQARSRLADDPDPDVRLALLHAGRAAFRSSATDPLRRSGHELRRARRRRDLAAPGASGTGETGPERPARSSDAPWVAVDLNRRYDLGRR